VQLQKQSGLRGVHQSYLGGVVWNVHQSAISKYYWLPDTVDVLNVIVPKITVQQRLDNILSLLQEAHAHSVSVLITSRTSFEKHRSSAMFSAAISQAFRCQFAAILHHYDEFSDSIRSLYVNVQQQQKLIICFCGILLEYFHSNYSSTLSIIFLQIFPSKCRHKNSITFHEFYKSLRYFGPKFRKNPKVLISAFFDASIYMRYFVQFKPINELE
jgi:hypothetical protein